MYVDYLANHSKWVPIIAGWTYDTWSKYDPTLTFERSLASIQSRLNIDSIPLTLVVIDNNRPIATANLKASVKVPGVPLDKIWLGSLFVLPEYRNKGVGSMLIHTIYTEAIKRGQSELYLFSSDTSVLPWYQRRDWRIISLLPFQNHTATVMKKDLY